MTSKHVDKMIQSTACLHLRLCCTAYSSLRYYVELQVNKNDKVIVQGDDGDNFYVVDRYWNFLTSVTTHCVRHSIDAGMSVCYSSSCRWSELLRRQCT